MRKLDRKGSDASISIECGLRGLELGESVAVDGVCLTVSELLDQGFSAAASAETLARTTLSGLAAGARVHLERALALGGRLGGHIVTGHVDAVGRVRDRREVGSALEVCYELPQSIARFVAEKGSIAVDGVSLTVNSVSQGAFGVMLVPFTRERTRLDRKRPGEPVNLEADVVAKYLARLAEPGPEPRAGVTLELLARHGFAR